MVAAAVRTIFAQPDQFDVIAGMLGRQFPKVETMLRDAADDLTAFAGFPAEHRKKIWSTNQLFFSGEGMGSDASGRYQQQSIVPSGATLAYTSVLPTIADRDAATR
jgi:hypothetical protein